MTSHKLPIRLAIRREGPMVNAYLAQANTMEDAKLLASLDVDIAGDKEIWERWKGLVSDVIARAVETTLGEKPDMIEEKASEHERTGTA